MDPPLAIEELQRELHQRIYRFLMRLRFVIAPLPLLVGGFVSITDATAWRRVAIAAAITLAILLSILNDWRVRRGGKASLEGVVLVVALVLHPILLLATGGVLSPVLIAMLLVCFVAATMLGRRTSAAILGCQLLAIWGVALVEYSQLLGSLVPLPFRSVVVAPASPALVVVFALVASTFFLVTRELGCRIQLVFAELLARAITAREESLRLHQEQLAALTLLSGEIAHELKNPLASVKGLAALLAKRGSGTESELLSVLRQEVDRMQRILEEFLNFSRPLVPLNLDDVELGALSADVVNLHLGMSEQAAVRIDVIAESMVIVRCDPRKVRQILINLLQNALEVSRAQGIIVLRVRASNDAAVVTVEDEGSGIDPALVGRIFEAGVTNKFGGSGLGLNVARGLARQHGGDINLAGRGPRGCIATLRLPLRPIEGAQGSPASPAEDGGA